MKRPNKGGDPKVLNRVSKMDAKYFRDHPGTVEYYRKFIIGECYFEPEDMPKPGFGLWTLVEEIKPGIRLRSFLQVKKNTVEEEEIRRGFVVFMPEPFPEVEKHKQLLRDFFKNA
jgi:hypothetical protein